MILDNDFPPDPRVENEAKRLIGAGHEVFLFCLGFGEEKTNSQIVDGIHVIKVGVPNWFYSLSSLAYTIPLYHLLLKNKIWSFLTENRIEIIHIHDIQVARAVFWLRKRLRLPIVLDLHENRPEIMKYYAHVNTKLGKLLIYPSLWKKFEFKYILQASKVITVTEEAIDYYLQHTAEDRSKFSAVINSVTKEFYTDYSLEKKILSQYKDKFTLLYIGDTGLRRGILTLFNSIKKLASEIPNLKVVIVGKSKEDNALRTYLQEHQLSAYVDMVGWQDPSLFQSYISSADIGLCPIHKNLHHDTTIANKLFQYMSFGKPVVVSNCTSQENLVNTYKCGLVFEDRNPGDLAEKILSLFKNETLKKELGKNAEALVKEKMHWEKSSLPLLEIYNNERY